MTGAEDLLARRRGGAALAPLDPAARTPAGRVAVLACMDARLGVTEGPAGERPPGKFPDYQLMP
ncbi:hypothetical protein AA958_02885 [Streptomyces sp. CNQ-509]|uniref:hypothetical protein n=1 Tax=Streptomyces sp. CNQ-509 TaxID=444103 RepID=UPI00062DED00|nr:hypothetical protein [Streptomyces sp. CNQ-509]AKH81292.1 hypothetical protein AA958_02885 [Streptomyces sp. CNQ-509]